ncbi:MAG: hypothetical protein ACERLM_04700 [Acidimicrobiales bacterium]
MTRRFTQVKKLKTLDQLRIHLAEGGIDLYALTHNETSTGVTGDIQGLRGVIDHVGHPALLLVDAI